MKLIKLKTIGDVGEFYTKVDEDDYEFLKFFRWRLSVFGYCYYASRSKPVYLHRMIMEPCDPFHVDHINGDPLDNRKKNLRLATAWENGNNKRWKKGTSSQYYGVTKLKDSDRWIASMGTRGEKKRVHLGRYNTELEAATAYDIACREHWKNLAILNFPKHLELVQPQRSKHGGSLGYRTIKFVYTTLSGEKCPVRISVSKENHVFLEEIKSKFL